MSRVQITPVSVFLVLRRDVKLWTRASESINWCNVAVIVLLSLSLSILLLISSFHLGVCIGLGNQKQVQGNKFLQTDVLNCWCYRLGWQEVRSLLMNDNCCFSLDRMCMLLRKTPKWQWKFMNVQTNRMTCWESRIWRLRTMLLPPTDTICCYMILCTQNFSISVPLYW